MIKCENISLSFGKNKILNNISFSALSGEITVILGKNGSGKTSLMRCISGSQKKWTGQVYANNINIKNLKEKERAKLISFLPQILPRPAITVRELTAFGRQPYADLFGHIDKDDNKIIDNALINSNMEKFSNKLVCHLSGGERQRAYFSMVLAQNTPIIILDEPTSSLDIEYKKIIFDFLTKMKKAGKTLIVIIHDLNDAVKIADKIIVLNNGEKIFENSSEEFTKSTIIETVFKTKAIDLKDSRGNVYKIFQ